MAHSIRVLFQKVVIYSIQNKYKVTPKWERKLDPKDSVKVPKSLRKQKPKTHFKFTIRGHAQNPTKRGLDSCKMEHQPECYSWGLRPPGKEEQISNIVAETIELDRNLGH